MYIRKDADNLGWLYEKGVGVDKDDVEALAWMSLAAQSGNANAVNDCNRIEKKLSPEKISLAQKRSQELVKLIKENRAKKARSGD